MLKYKNMKYKGEKESIVEEKKQVYDLDYDEDLIVDDSIN